MTLSREVSEELGVPKYALKIGGLFDASVSKLKVQPGKKIPLVLVTFNCKLKEGKFRLSNEHVKYNWAPVATAAKLLSTKFNNAFIEKLVTQE